MNQKSGFQKLGVFWPALLCTALWGSAIPVVKTGYELFAIAPDDAFAKLFFAGVRFLLAGLAVIALTVILGRRPIVPERSQWSGIVALSAAQTIMQYFFFYLGLGNTSGVRGSVLSATSTFFSVILAHFVFSDDRLTPRKVVGCLAGFGGVLVILGGGLAVGGVRLTGEGFVLISALGQGLGALVSRKITPGRDPMQITGWQLAFGGCVLLAVGLLGGGARYLSVTGPGLALLAYLAALTSVSFSVWTVLLKHHPVGKVMIYMFLIPVFGAVLSGIMLGESIFTARNFAALVLVSVGIAVVNGASAQGEKGKKRV